MIDETHINEFKNYLTNVKKKSENTAKLYCRSIKLFYDIIAKPYAELTRDDIVDFVDKITSGDFKSNLRKIQKYDSNSLTPLLCGVKKYLGFLKNKKHINIEIDDDLEETLKPPKWNSKGDKKRYLTPDERDRLFDISKSNPRAYALIQLFYATGGRVSEIIALNKDSIHKEGNDYTITLYLKKTQEWHTRTITSECYESVQRYLDLENMYLPEKNEKILPKARNALFVTCCGYRISADNVWKIIKAQGAKIGIDIYPHMIRHTTDTDMIRAGMTSFQISSHTKQSVKTIEKFYAHIGKEDIKESVVNALSRKKQEPQNTQTSEDKKPEPPQQSIYQQTPIDKALELEMLKQKNLDKQLELAKLQDRTQTYIG